MKLSGVEHAANIELAWHQSCLGAYRAASGQKAGIQVTMCEGGDGPAAELDHRLAINVVRALGPEALRRAFILENLGRLCRDCHRGKTRLDRTLARFLLASSLDWRRVLRVWRLNRRWVGRSLEPSTRRYRERASGTPPSGGGSAWLDRRAVVLRPGN